MTAVTADAAVPPSEQGVVRGLLEELGIAACLSDVQGPLQPTHQRQLRQGEFHDVELVRSYRIRQYDGPVAFADGEVVEVRWVAVGRLRDEVGAAPQEFTQWMKEESAALEWFGAEGVGGEARAEHAAQPP